jgi:hypothetical protein
MSYTTESQLSLLCTNADIKHTGEAITTHIAYKHTSKMGPLQ